MDTRMKISKSFLIMIASFAAMIVIWGISISNRHSRYVIVTEEKGKEGWDASAQAVKELAKLRHPSAVLTLDADGLKNVFRELKILKPKYVAFVVHPERIEDNFVGDVFAGLTALDEDPYLDCAYGFITGATPQEALRLVRNTATAQAGLDRIPKKFVAIAHTFAQNDLAPFAVQEANRYAAYGYQTAQINPIDDSEEWNLIRGAPCRERCATPRDKNAIGFCKDSHWIREVRKTESAHHTVKGAVTER